MGKSRSTRIVLTLSVLVIAGCSSNSSNGSGARGPDIVSACSGHGGVAAFDDDAVICADQTFRGERAEGAVAACRRHGGATAFDDNIVICRDETFHNAPGG